MNKIVGKTRVMEPGTIKKNRERRKSQGNSQNLKMFCMLLTLILFSSISSLAQNVYDLNMDVQTNLLRSDPSVPQEILKEAKAARAFAINPALQHTGAIKVSDIINLQLFENENYTSTVSKILTDVNENFTLLLKLPDYPMAFGFITTNKMGKSLFILTIPELNQKFASRSSIYSSDSYLLEIDKSQIPHDENDAIPIPKRTVINADSVTITKNNATFRSTVANCTASLTSADPAEIDLLIVYTPAAAAWAASNEGGISNTIAGAMAQTKSVVDNEGGGDVITCVHSEQVDYTEYTPWDMSTDLNRLTETTDGYMDNIHQLRKQYNADIVVLIESYDGTDAGGLGWILGDATYGNYDHAFNVIRVQQTSWTTTSIHEIGHNLGMLHNAENNTMNPPLYSYAYGWHWTGNDGNEYGSVMSYIGIETPYYSNPQINYMGKPTGTSTADNAQVFRDTKQVVAFYSDKLANLPDMPTNIAVSNPTDNGATFSWNASANAIEYLFCKLTTGGYSYFTTTNTTFTINYSDWFQPCTSYDFFIQAVNACGDVVRSPTQTFQTKCSTNYTVSTSSIPATGGTTSGGGSYASGASCTVAATANTGYTFTNWTENGSVVSTSSNYTFTVSSDRSLASNFTPVTYTVAYNGNGNTGGSTASSSHTYNAAQNLTNNGFTRAYTVTYNYNDNGGQSNETATATYTFKNWNTLSGGGGTTYTNGQSVVNLSSTNGATVPLYAQWNNGTVSLPTPNERTGYTFSGWYTAASGGTYLGSGGATYTPTATLTLYAQWTTNPVITYNINTSSNPTAGGSTSGGGTYNSGTSCTVNASANSGYSFVNWSENGNNASTSPSYTFTVAANRNLVANFTPQNTWQIGSPNAADVTATFNNGTLTISGKGATQDWIYNNTTLPWHDVRLNITNVVINSGVTTIGNNAFLDCNSLTSVNIPNTLTSIGIDAFLNCTALTSVNIPNSITVIGNNAFQNCSKLTSVTVNWATPLSIDGSVFSGITLSNVALNVPTGTQCAYASALVWKDFNIAGASFTVTPSAGSGGSISPNSVQTAICGSSITFTATPNSGKQVDQWILNGSAAQTGGTTYTISNVTANHTISVTFAQNQQYTITTSSNPSVGGTTSGNGVFYSGVSCTVCASVNNGYTFTNWTENGSVVSTNTCYTFTVSANRSLVANFTQQTPIEDITVDAITSNLTTISSLSQTFTLTVSALFNRSAKSLARRVGFALYDSNGTTEIGYSPARINFDDLQSGRGWSSFPTDQTLNDFALTSLPASGTYRIYPVVSDDLTDPYRPYEFIKGTDGSDKYATITIINNNNVGIEEISANQLTIYPNPVKNELFIKTDLQIKKVEVSDLAGHNVKILHATPSQNGVLKVSISSLLKGVYLVKVYTDKDVINSKIIKK